MTIGLVTAIFDNYDSLKPQRLQSIHEAVCVTDNPELTGEGWDIVVISRPPHETGRIACKHPKMFPWTYVRRPHNIYITIDGAFSTNAVDFDIEKYLPLGEELCQWPNMFRGCPYAEGLFSQKLDKYQDDLLAEQMSFYQTEGLPPNSGLWSNGLIIRRDTPRMREFEVAWYREFQRWGVQDQVSHAYVCWKMGLKPYVPEQGSVVTNELAIWRGHLA